MTVTYFATGDGNGLVTFDVIKVRAKIQQNLHCNCRAKMAASFKLPCLVKKRKPPANFPRFEWGDISIKDQLGSGTFGLCVSGELRKRRAKYHRKENERRVGRG